MTEQSERWRAFGDAYTKRNPNAAQEEELSRERYGFTRTEMNDEFLADVPRSARIPEVGCNVGVQLNLLAGMGFESLYGIEVNRYAIEVSRNLNMSLPVYPVHATATDLPIKDGWFDLVFTSGVLIHISPEDVAVVMHEMVRCSSRWIWGLEYFTDEGYVEIPYHGESRMLWKTDFALLLRETSPELRTVRECRYPYLDEPGLVDQMYLLEKSQA